MAALPLLTRASEDGVTFVLTPRVRLREDPIADVGSPGLLRMPDRKPGPGEQYRFHFDMGQCIGCKCCVVACNEQNGNPATINWRRVGEVEGGFFPNAKRAYFSMGCNHCLEPTCLTGCPVDAYSKDPVTGIVRHSAETCIGCQYCTWNCSYGVPQFNPERGVVGKCDMCHGRLERDEAPACVAACPESAIRIEIVSIADWRAQATLSSTSATAPAGMPTADASLSTTLVTMPKSLPPNARPFDLTHVRPAEAHWSLIVMTVLTQLSVGALASVWLLQLMGAVDHLGLAALASLGVGGLALAAATLHLGRPIHAYRALKMWRRSWLSREVLLFALFSNVAAIYAGALWFGIDHSEVLGAVTVMLGIGGVTASACIYRVASRPAWHSSLTPVQFGATAAVLGPLFAAAVGAGEVSTLAPAVALFALIQMVLMAIAVLRLIASDTIELRGTARLLATSLARPVIARALLLVIGGIVIPLTTVEAPWVWVSLALVLASEMLGRWLFFTSVVPKHMTTPYLPIGSEAA
jgi:Fe-S-cluster-containing dehydrogenase component/DMSO reductase anchor subunit